MSNYELTEEEDALYDMSDDELEAAFKAAKAGMQTDEVEDDEVEEIDDNTEQPDEVEEDSEDVESNKGDEEVVEDAGDGSEEPDEVEADKPEEVDEIADEEPKIAKYKVKANGTELELTNDELLQLAPKALNYTQKMQEIAPWRKSISALKDNGMTHDDVNLMIDIMKGDKDAIAEIVKRHKIDTLELDVEESKYRPRDYGKDENELALEDVVNSIKKDPEFKVTQYVVDDAWDVKSRGELAKNPSMIEGLHVDIKNGTFDKVNPIALKLKALDGARKTDLDYYLEAGSQHYAELRRVQEVEANKTKLLADKEAAKAKVIEDVKVREIKQTEVKKASEARKAAAPTKKAAGSGKIIDYLDDISDDNFDAWYKDLQSKR